MSSVTRITVATQPAHLWQGYLDRGSQLLDIYDASFHRGRLVVHGVAPEQRAAVRAMLEPYRHFVESYPGRSRFVDSFELSTEPLRWTECERVEERSSFFLSPWHPDNAYHVHADNLLPMFANLRHAGKLDQPRVLYLFAGNASRNARAVQLFDLLAHLFDGAVEPFAALRTSGRIGFRHIRWGRGPQIPYLRDARGTPFEGAADAYRRWVLAHFDIAPRSAPVAPEARPALLYLDRTLPPRRLANPDLLVQAFADTGHDLRVVKNLDRYSCANLVSLAQQTDVLMGVHGAALAHMVYQPPGSVVVELLTGSHQDSPVFPQLSQHFGQRIERMDLPGRAGPDGWEISRTDADNVVARTLEVWRRRSEPATITVSALGSGNWGNEVFWYMFGKSYARRFGLRFESSPWAGQDLIGARDPSIVKPLTDVHEKTEHGRFDTRIPHAPPYRDVNFVGYFQYHTSHYRPDRAYLQALFQPAPDVAALITPRWRKIRERGATVVAVHVRRGDYGFRYFYRTPTAWYLRTLDQLWPQLDRPVLYVATDDPALVLPDFARFDPVSASDLGPPLAAHDFYRDFYALQHADVVAISNSTFSFAAAMMNTGLRQAFRPHLPSRRLIPFDPWDDKPLQQERSFHVERYPWLPELWRPTPAPTRWARWVRHHAAGLVRRVDARLRWIHRLVRSNPRDLYRRRVVPLIRPPRG